MSYSDDDYNYSLAYLVFGFDFIPDRRHRARPRGTAQWLP